MATEEGRGEGGQLNSGVILSVNSGASTGLNGHASGLNGKVLNGSTTSNAVNDKIDKRPQRLSALK